MNIFSKIAIVSSLCVFMSACERPEITITAKWPSKQNMVYGDSSATTSTAEIVNLSGSISAPQGSNVTLDASAMSIDVSSSNVAFPTSGAATLNLRNSAGGLISARSFGWTRVGSTLRFSSPSSVNSWLQSTGANPYTSRIDYSIDASVSTVQGENYVGATVNMYNQPLATGFSSYNPGGGGDCRYCQEK